MIKIGLNLLLAEMKNYFLKILVENKKSLSEIYLKLLMKKLELVLIAVSAVNVSEKYKSYSLRIEQNIQNL